jgi:hypothetical protein
MASIISIMVGLLEDKWWWWSPSRDFAFWFEKEEPRRLELKCQPHPQERLH